MRAWQVAYALGAGGAVPFVALTPQVVQQLPMPQLRTHAAKAQVCYGSAILSFLGGVQWGATVVQPHLSVPTTLARLSWAVTPSLVAWPAASMAESTQTSCSILSGGLASAWVADTFVFNSGLPLWCVF